MRALTVSQPYSSLIASGQKFVENRNYPIKYRGPLAIHAGKGTQYLTKEELAKYPTGCVVAVTELVACFPLSRLQTMAQSGAEFDDSHLTVREILDHKHTEGPWLWILSNTRELEVPIPWKGALGLWELPDDALVAGMAK